MIRLFHRWPGLLALALVTLLSLTGAALSVFPAIERLSSPQAEAGLSVAELAGRIIAVHPGVEQIKRSPSGRIMASWTENGDSATAIIDPATGEGIAAAEPNAWQRWLTTFHRSLFLDDGGRLVMAAGALAMLTLSVTGIVMIARHAGGWRHWFSPAKGKLLARVHIDIARISVAGLILSSVTALWMTASTFGLVPDQPSPPAIPAEVSGQTGVPVASLQILKDTVVADLRELTFPVPDDSADVFTLKTIHGLGTIDQGTGAVLTWQNATVWERASATVTMLHTGVALRCSDCCSGCLPSAFQRWLSPGPSCGCRAAGPV